MGKSGLGAGAQSVSASAGEQENAGEVAPSACCSVSGVCLRSTLKWIIAVVLGMNLLLFAIFSLPVFGKGYPAGKQGSESPQTFISIADGVGAIKDSSTNWWEAGSLGYMGSTFLTDKDQIGNQCKPCADFPQPSCC